MQNFQYQAQDISGKIIQDQQTAESERDLVRQLRAKKLIPLDIKPIKAKSLEKDHGRIRHNDLIDFYEGLATLLEAAVPLDRALLLLQSLVERDALQKQISTMRGEVKEGRSLAESMAARPKIFSRMMISIVRAGEEGGILHRLLPELVSFLRNAEETKRQAVSALIYPAILFLVGIASVVLMLVYVVPRFAGIFEGSGAAIPPAAEFLLNTSAWLKNYGWLLLVLIGGIVVWWKSLAYSATGRLWRDHWLLRWPMLGKLLLLQNSAHFARTLSALLSAGIPLVQGLVISRGVMENRALSAALKNVEKDVRAGKGLGDSLKKTEQFPILLHQLVVIGEESGRTAQVLEQVANSYDQEVKKQVTRLVALLEPILILFLAVFVGGIVVTMLSAVFSLNDIGV